MAKELLESYPLSLPHLHPVYNKDRVSPKRVSGGKVINKKKPHQATMPGTAWMTQPIYVPERDNPPAPIRPGADDHLRYKSLNSGACAVYADWGHA